MRGIADRRAAGLLAGRAHEGRASPARWCTGRSNVLLDEPTNGLDVMSTRAMRELIRAAARARATACCSPAT